MENLKQTKAFSLAEEVSPDGVMQINPFGNPKRSNLVVVVNLDPAMCVDCPANRHCQTSVAVEIPEYGGETTATLCKAGKGIRNCCI
mgnify:CR=1 FL=1